MPRVQRKTQSSMWLAMELLKRTNLPSGDICMYHYPLDYETSFVSEEMGEALAMISEADFFQRGEDGTIGDFRQDQGDTVQHYMFNASLHARNQVRGIQFSWYHFNELPRALGRTYANLQHLDIRQNATLTSIDSIVSQLPHLTSLNLSNCPNIRTLAPLARQGTLQAYDPSLQPELDGVHHFPVRHRLNLRHLWVRGCNLSSMTREEWAEIFDALAESSGPLERLTLSRNNMTYLHPNVGKLKRLAYLFVEDNDSSPARDISVPSTAFEIPDELGNLKRLRLVSLCGNNIIALPRTIGRIDDKCDLYLDRNPNLVYPPPKNRGSIKAIRRFFHEERMALLRGMALFVPHFNRARWRAVDRLYKPGGLGYIACEESWSRCIGLCSNTDTLPLPTVCINNH